MHNFKKYRWYIISKDSRTVVTDFRSDILIGSVRGSDFGREFGPDFKNIQKSGPDQMYFVILPGLEFDSDFKSVESWMAGQWTVVHDSWFFQKSEPKSGLIFDDFRILTKIKGSYL